MAMAEQQWSNFNSGQWNTQMRSDHAVSQPIMLGKGNSSAISDSGPASPSQGESFIYRQMAEGVIASSPQSALQTPLADSGMRHFEKQLEENKHAAGMPLMFTGAMPIPMGASPPDMNAHFMMQQQGGGYGYGSWGAVYPPPPQTTPIATGTGMMPPAGPPPIHGTPTAASAAAAGPGLRVRHDSTMSNMSNLYGTSPPFNHMLTMSQLQQSFAALNTAGGGPPTPNRNDPYSQFFMGGHPGMMMPNGGMPPFASTPPSQSLAGSPATTIFNSIMQNQQYWNVAAFTHQQRQAAAAAAAYGQ